MKRIWVAAIAVAVVCGGIHLGNAETPGENDKSNVMKSLDVNHPLNTKSIKVDHPDPSKLTRPPTTVTNSTTIQGMLIQSSLDKQKQYCEAAKTVLSEIKKKEVFTALLDDIGATCDASIPDFKCVVKSANKVWVTTEVDEMLLNAKCAVLKRGDHTNSTFTD